MKKVLILVSVLLAALVYQSSVFAAFTLRSSDITPNTVLPTKFAYAKPSSRGIARESRNISPPLQWSGAPRGTKSFVILVSDRDVPLDKGYNLTNHTIRTNVKRKTGYLWVLANIPGNLRALPRKAGSIKSSRHSNRAVTKYGLNGLNMYTAIFRSPMGQRVAFSKRQLDRPQIGYDGPFPPWNDMKTHRIRFTIYALNVGHLNLPTNGMFTAHDVVRKMRRHVLGRASFQVKYTTRNHH